MAGHDLPTKPGSDHSVILLATPCYGGLVHQAYMMRRAEEEGFHLDLALLGNDPLITRSRSIIVAKFLDPPQATHLLFVDADIAFEPEQLLRMLPLPAEDDQLGGSSAQRGRRRRARHGWTLLCRNAPRSQ